MLPECYLCTTVALPWRCRGTTQMLRDRPPNREKETLALVWVKCLQVLQLPVAHQYVPSFPRNLFISIFRRPLSSRRACSRLRRTRTGSPYIPASRPNGSPRPECLAKSPACAPHPTG